MNHSFFGEPNRVRSSAAAAAFWIALTAGCYAHQGSPLDASPESLMRTADAACQRNDQRGYETLLERLLREYPDSEEALHARRLIAETAACQPNERSTRPRH